MFDRQYPFTFIQTKTDQNEPYLFEHLYSFKGKVRYIVVIQEFVYNFYAVKFYAKAHSNSKRKYNLLTQLLHFSKKG